MASITERFWPKVRRTGTCWHWTASTCNGYGQLSSRRGRSPFKAHRVSWEIHYGAIPEGQDVLHRCDNPPCVNPAHLFLGDAGTNGRDMASKGRAGLQQHPELIKRGREQSQAKLNDLSVKEIRRRCRNGEPKRVIAKDFSVDRKLIYQIEARKKWAHVED